MFLLSLIAMLLPYGALAEEAPVVTLEQLKPVLECFAEPLKDPALEEISFLARQINRFLGAEAIVAKSDRFNSWEKKVLRKYPKLGLALGNARCRAIALSTAACGVDVSAKDWVNKMQDEETDALRHFFFVFILASANGPEAAELYSIAHEGDPAGWDGRNYMDLFNNYVGMQVYREMAAAGADPHFSDRTLLQVAINALKEGRLFTIERTWESRCSTGEVFYRSPEDILKDARKNYRQLENTSCHLPMGIF